MYTLKIKYYRIRHNLTQRQLATLIGVTQSYIAKIESNNRDGSPTLHVLEKLSDLFSVSLNELTGSKYIPLLVFFVIKK